LNQFAKLGAMLAYRVAVVVPPFMGYQAAGFDHELAHLLLFGRNRTLLLWANKHPDATVQM